MKTTRASIVCDVRLRGLELDVESRGVWSRGHATLDILNAEGFVLATFRAAFDPMGPEGQALIRSIEEAQRACFFPREPDLSAPAERELDTSVKQI